MSFSVSKSTAVLVGAQTNTCFSSCNTNRMACTMVVVFPVPGGPCTTAISLADKIECSAFLWVKQANRKATPIVSVSLAQAKNTAKLPAGKNTLLVIGQNIDDRTAVLFWEMFVKPNTKYVVTVKNEVKDKFVFGSPASALAITVLENGIPLTVKQVAEPTEEDCKNQ